MYAGKIVTWNPNMTDPQHYEQSLEVLLGSALPCSYQRDEQQLDISFSLSRNMYEYVCYIFVLVQGVCKFLLVTIQTLSVFEGHYL